MFLIAMYRIFHVTTDIIIIVQKLNCQLDHYFYEYQNIHGYKQEEIEHRDVLNRIKCPAIIVASCQCYVLGPVRVCPIWCGSGELPTLSLCIGNNKLMP